MVSACIAVAFGIALFGAVTAHIIDKAFLKRVGANILGRFGYAFGLMVWEAIVTVAGLFGGFTVGLWLLSTFHLFAC